MFAGDVLPVFHSMTLEQLRNFCLSLPGTSEYLPFDENTLAFRVGSKIFALVDIELTESVNLKCNPERAVELRELHDEIVPGYHMNKKHWNTVSLKGSLSIVLLCDLIKHSYELVYKSLPKNEKSEIEAL